VSTSSTAALGAALGATGGISVALGDFCRMVEVRRLPSRRTWSCIADCHR
jgi:hypothetical protein